MGGHSAWRKRVAQGLPAKGSGGAICRHRPHLGRKGKDLILNRKGHIGGGNPKKKKMKRHNSNSNNNNDKDDKADSGGQVVVVVATTSRHKILLAVMISLVGAYSIAIIMFGWNAVQVFSYSK